MLTFGRSGVDIYPLQIGVGLEDVKTFGKYLGGTTANVAVAAARLGREPRIITGVGNDPFGRFVRRALRELGVDDRHVVTNHEYATPVTFCEIFPPDDFPLWFYRKPTAPDLQVNARRHRLRRRPRDPADVAVGDRTQRGAEPGVATSPCSRRAPASSSPCSTWTTARCSGRPRRTPTEQVQQGAAARHRRRRQPRGVRGRGRRDRARAGGRRAAGAGVELAIVKQGPKGVLAKTRTERVESPPIPIRPLNGLGAGDSFGGSLCHGLLAGWPLEKVLQHANAAGAIVASRLECSTAMPTEARSRPCSPAATRTSGLADSLRRALRRLEPAMSTVTQTRPSGTPRVRGARFVSSVAEINEVRVREPERIEQLLAARRARAVRAATAS